MNRIESMRTYFRAAGHDVDVETFARAMLAARQRQAARTVRELGFAPADALAILAVELPATTDLSERGVVGYVNAGEWKAKCECGGVEYIDLEYPLFMCCSCWNRADDYRWRQVVMPKARRVIERVLVARPDPMTRNWRASETVRELIGENRQHGLPARAA